MYRSLSISTTIDVVTLLETPRLRGTRADDSAVCCTPLVREPLDAAQADELARTLKALADPARLRLLSIVAASADQEACVCDLTEPIGLAQPTVSHHLRVLTEAGFLTRSKRGTWAYFKLVPGSLDRMSQLLVAT